MQCELPLVQVHTIRNGVCTACGYPPRRADACDNPACVANPTLSEAHKARLMADAEAVRQRRAAEDKARADKARLRAAGFTTF